MFDKIILLTFIIQLVICAPSNFNNYIYHIESLDIE